MLAWESGFQNGSNVGGLVSAVLGPAGGFGKFLVVLISLTVPSAASPAMYTFGTLFIPLYPPDIEKNAQVQVSWRSLPFSPEYRDTSLPLFRKLCLFFILVHIAVKHLISNSSLIPVAIVGAKRFYTTLVDVVGELPLR